MVFLDLGERGHSEPPTMAAVLPLLLPARDRAASPDSEPVTVILECFRDRPLDVRRLAERTRIV